MKPLPEPPKDRSVDSLQPPFRAKLEAVMAALAKAGVPFKIDETDRTEERQAWLFASGRTRPGPVITQKDGAPGVWPMDYEVVSERGKTRQSNHQGGWAADLYPLRPDGRIYIPPASHEAWVLLATTARAFGLRPGRDWGDSPHVEFAGTRPKPEPQKAE